MEIVPSPKNESVLHTVGKMTCCRLWRIQAVQYIAFMF